MRVKFPLFLESPKDIKWLAKHDYQDLKIVPAESIYKKKAAPERWP